MDDNFVPFKVYESSQARSDRRFRYMFVLIVIMVIAFICSNIGWIIYESRYTEEVTTIESTQDGSGVNIVGGGNIYGSDSEDNY